jgi:hypothetical protein
MGIETVICEMLGANSAVACYVASFWDEGSLRPLLLAEPCRHELCHPERSEAEPRDLR